MSSAAVATTSIQPGMPVADLEKLLAERFALVRDVRDQWDLTLVVPVARLRDVVAFVRDDQHLRFDTLLDCAGIDYLAYPGHVGPRFAVIYNFKSTVFHHRVKLKIELDEDAAQADSLHDLFRIANWQEREVFDQIGVLFVGHPNLKRLLNHHEFVGHPLRKDYPCQKRQKLSVNDPLVDQLEARLIAKGYTILDRGVESKATPIAFKDPAKPAAQQGVGS